MGLFKKNKKNATVNEQSKEKGVFHGFALLSEPKWSKTQFVAEKITLFLIPLLKENFKGTAKDA